MATVIPLRRPLRVPSAERMREIFAAADEAWPEYEAALEAEREAEEREAEERAVPRLRLIR